MIKRKLKLIIILVVVAALIALAIALYQRHLLKQGRKTPPPIGVAVAAEVSNLALGAAAWIRGLEFEPFWKP